MRFGELELNADGYADLFDAEVNESCTSMRCYGQVVIAVSSMTAGTYRTRRAKPSSSIGVFNVSTVEPAYSQTVRRLISRPVQLHVLMSSMPSKSSPLDVLPISLLKSWAHMFVPAVARLTSLSLQTGKFSAGYKRVQVLPLLKKAGLDSSQLANYRQISNLPTVSKVLERLVLAQLRPHLLSSANFSQFQSAYRKGHSMETALLEVLDGVFMVADDKQVTVMIGLHLSAAFDTIDHRLLLDRLLLEFGVMEILLRWLQSYLSSSRWASTNHTPLKSTWASRKGLCLDLCCSWSILQPDRRRHLSPWHTVSSIRRRHAAPSHYACQQHTRRAVRSRRVYHDVRQWYLQISLQLNPDKSEALILGTANQLHATTSSVSSVSVAGVDLPVADEIKVLRVVLDQCLTFHTRVGGGVIM